MYCGSCGKLWINLRLWVKISVYNGFYSHLVLLLKSSIDHHHISNQINIELYNLTINYSWKEKSERERERSPFP